MPSRRHPTCEERGRRRQDGIRQELSAWERFFFALPPPLRLPLTHLSLTHALSLPYPRFVSPRPLPAKKKGDTLSPLSPEMTPPAGLWNILILFPNSYYVWSV